MQKREVPPMMETSQVAGAFEEQEHLLRKPAALPQMILLPPTRRQSSFWKGLLLGAGTALSASLILVGGWYLGQVIVTATEPEAPGAQISLSQPGAVANQETEKEVEEPTSLAMIEPEIAVSSPEPEEVELPAAAIPAPKEPKAAPKAPKLTEPKTSSKAQAPKAPEPTATAPKTSSGCDPDDVVCALINDKSEAAAPSYPSQLSQSEIEAVARRGIYTPCTVIGTGRVAVGATIDSSGKVVSAWGQSPLAECAASRLKNSVRFPRISSDSQSFVVVVEVR